jgi:hypothetical protein
MIFPKANIFTRFGLATFKIVLEYSINNVKVVRDVDAEFSKLRFRFPSAGYIALSR